MLVYLNNLLNPQIETRLLTIVTREYEDDLICSISHVCLEIPLVYEALSYVWAYSLCNQNDDDDGLDKKSKPRLI